MYELYKVCKTKSKTRTYYLIILKFMLKFCPSKSKARDLKMCYKTLNIKQFTAVNEDPEY